LSLLDEVDELEDDDFGGMLFYPNQRPQYFLMQKPPVINKP